MTSAVQEILEKAKTLSHDERVVLIEALCDTFEDEPTTLSDEWKTEIASRIAQLERGEVQAIPWSEVEARIRRTLDQP